jgi:hypothetical protein
MPQRTIDAARDPETMTAAERRAGVASGIGCYMAMSLSSRWSSAWTSLSDGSGGM